MIRCNTDNKRPQKPMIGGERGGGVGRGKGEGGRGEGEGIS